MDFVDPLETCKKCGTVPCTCSLTPPPEPTPEPDAAPETPVDTTPDTEETDKAADINTTNTPAETAPITVIGKVVLCIDDEGDGEDESSESEEECENTWLVIETDGGEYIIIENAITARLDGLEGMMIAITGYAGTVCGDLFITPTAIAVVDDDDDQPTDEDDESDATTADTLNTTLPNANTAIPLPGPCDDCHKERHDDCRLGEGDCRHQESPNAVIGVNDTPLPDPPTEAPEPDKTPTDAA